MKLSVFDADAYISERFKQIKRETRQDIVLAYSQVLWSKLEGEDFPKLSDLLEMDEEEKALEKPQSVSEQEDILRTFAARGARRR